MTDTRTQLIETIEPFLLTPHFREPEVRCALDFRSDADRDASAAGSPRGGLTELLGDDTLPVGAFDAVLTGGWAPPGMRGVYLVRETFSKPKGEVVRWAIVGALDPVENDVFPPVVMADRSTVDASIRNVRQAGVDPGSVVALYRDEELRIERLIEARQEIDPIVEYSLDEGQFAVWCLSPEESAAVIAVLVQCGGAVVGDLSLYRALQRLRDDDLISPQQRPLVRFYNQRDFAVSFAATARVYRTPESLDPNAIVSGLHRVASVEEIELGDPAQLEPIAEQLRSEAISNRTTALFLRGSRTVYLVRTPLDSVDLIGHENPPAVASEFDVEWIEKGLLRRLFPDFEGTAERVFSDPEAAYRSVQAGEGELGFLVNPPPKRAITGLRESGWRLPRNSLLLKPPVPRGLIMGQLVPRVV